MSIWFVSWVLLSVVLLGFLAWTYFIVFRQKQAWRQYAQKNGLKFRANKGFESPEMKGKIGGYGLSFFTSEHQSPDMRRARKLTAIEVFLKSRLSVTLTVASGDMVALIQDLEGGIDYVVPSSDWDTQERLVKAESEAAAQAYLSQERLQALDELMALSNASVILIFRENAAFLRLDTPLALETEEQLQSHVQALLKCAKICELAEGEAPQIQNKHENRKAAQVALEVDEDTLSNSGLQLEDDQVDQDDADENPSTENS